MVQRYTPGGHYTLHHDAPPNEEGDSSLRVATALVYLNDLSEGSGGETIFPGGGGLQEAPAWVYQSQAGGLELCGRVRLAQNAAVSRPKCGTALVFFPSTPAGIQDESALHGSCPVAPGQTKWVAQKWFRGRYHAPEDDTSLDGFWPLTMPLELHQGKTREVQTETEVGALAHSLTRVFE